jgi:hypothetical protein
MARFTAFAVSVHLVSTAWSRHSVVPAANAIMEGLSFTAQFAIIVDTGRHQYIAQSAQDVHTESAETTARFATDVHITKERTNASFANAFAWLLKLKNPAARNSEWP